MNYLGIDWGRKKIGLAIGNEITKIALPIMIIKPKDSADLIEQLAKVIKDDSISAIVIGRPVSLSGEIHENKDLTRFIEKINDFGLPIIIEDERYSTKYVESIAHSLGQKRKADDDDIAAAAILQIYLDRTF